MSFLRHGGIYRSDIVAVEPGVAAPPPVGRRPCPGKGRDGRSASCSSASSAMSSGRLFLDRVALQQSPSPLYRQPQYGSPHAVAAIGNQRMVDCPKFPCLTRGVHRQ